MYKWVIALLDLYYTARYNISMALRKSILTPKQKETLNFIESYISTNKFSPLVSEIQKHFKLKSLRSVTQRLDSLEQKGLITRSRFQHRGIMVVNNNTFSIGKNFIQVPVIASVGCDNQSVYAQETFGQYLTVDESVINHHKDVFAFKAEGNSMADAGIKNGDYVLVEQTPYVKNGDRVVAIVGDMAVLKRFQRTGDNIILQPEAKGYQPIIVGENFKIFGKFIKTISMSSEQEEDIHFDPIY